ncbi:hypothetical protein F5888DRAFT_1893003 [Russula emetica]|nr:hypothetical protein F5888DRAFT_1930500 [Russula emetica]KAF8489281.1 hypothetical protein F5888DRAFT_1893003 [Russula emetica]
MQLFTVLLTALALVSSTTALPVAVAHDASRRSEDIVYSPPIMSPSQGTVWKVGSQQIVTWDASSVPVGAEGNKGTIMLGYADNTESEHLNYKHPLADGFLLTAGQQSITVPNVPKKSTYFVAVLGDSGNISQKFTISPS